MHHYQRRTSRISDLLLSMLSEHLSRAYPNHVRQAALALHRSLSLNPPRRVQALPQPSARHPEHALVPSDTSIAVVTAPPRPSDSSYFQNQTWIVWAEM